MALDQTRPELGFAIKAVRQAAQMAQRVQSGMALMNLTKSDLSPVTVSDFAAQALIAKGLKEEFPGDVLVAEERSAMLRDPKGEEVLNTVTRFVSRLCEGATGEDICNWIDEGMGAPEGRFWVLDPVDGTKGYMRGGQYAVALALVEDGTVQLGVLGCPNLSEGCEAQSLGTGVLIVAVRGQGAWETALHEDADFTALNVSATADPVAARVLRSYESGHTNEEQLQAVVDAMGSTADPVLMDSQAKYAVMAAGKGDLLFRLLSPEQPDYRERIWDQAAGSIIIEEAGGRVSDLEGKPLDFTAGTTLANNRGVLASNGLLHDKALEAIASIMG